MNVPDSYLAYHRRRRGTDTDMFADRRLEHIRPFSWPTGAKVVVTVIVNVQHFPLDMGKTPFVPTGGMERAYPDLWNYTTREYGNRVGIYRLIETFDTLGIAPTFTVNADIADRCPGLLGDIDSRGWEVAAGGRSMGHLHHAGLTEDEERALIAGSIDRLRSEVSRPIRGWGSPAGHQSPRTVDLLAEAGIDYLTDLVNDELPFAVTARGGNMTAVPVSTELSDVRLVGQQHHSTPDYVAEVTAAHKFLLNEARDAGRLLTLSVTPWIMGQAHRTANFRDLLDRLSSDPATCFMDCAGIVDCWNDIEPGRGIIG